MEPEKRTGKLIKAEKLMVERQGEQVQYSKESEYQGIKTLYYYHKLEFDNGDAGTARTKKPEGNFVIGHNYSYNKREFENNGYKNQSYSYLKDLDKPAFGGRSFNPEQQKEILNQVAFIATNLVKTDVEYMTVYGEFRRWLYEQVIDKKENSASMCGVLKIAAGYFAERKTTPNKVLEFADKLITKVKDTSWKSQSQTNTQNLSAQPNVQPQSEAENYLQGGSPASKTPPIDDLPFVLTILLTVGTLIQFLM